MISTLRRLAGVAVAVAMVVMFPVSANATETSEQAPYAATVMAQDAGAVAEADLHGDQAGKHSELAPPKADQRVGAQQAWYYHINASCSGYEGAIVQGANFWGGGVRTASSGTPVDCTSGYVQGCGGTYVVGCNWGMGDRIMLSTMVNDFALLSAHEFGHNWYGHSAQGCASWGSAYNVMKTTMC